jgi:N-glycosylase/DNA lyase
LSAAISSDPQPPLVCARFAAAEYDLDATLNSGQAFRWRRAGNGWEGVIGQRWVRLRRDNETTLTAEAMAPVSDWTWLTDYLQLGLGLETVLATFPRDEPLGAAVKACRGLRLLRQDPWECLASFILSSTKQIVQIRQIVAVLCERYGQPLPAPAGSGPARGFPDAARFARAGELELRGCKMGFRAPYLVAAARRVADGDLDLDALRRLSPAEARAQLMALPGVGPKIADCVLLFAYGFPEVFPVDVWVMKALQTLYFPRRRATPKRLHQFAKSYFGPNAGYAQQYLFHYIRTHRPAASAASPVTHLRGRSQPEDVRSSHFGAAKARLPSSTIRTPA